MKVWPGLSDVGAVIATLAVTATVPPEALQVSTNGADVYVVVPAASATDAGVMTAASTLTASASRVRLSVRIAVWSVDKSPALLLMFDPCGAKP